MLSSAVTPVMVTDLNGTTADASPGRFFAGSNTLLFAANDGVSGFELWKTDGTAPGTQLVKDIRPGAGPSSAASSSSTPMTWGGLDGGVTIFVADDGVHGLELWRTDGTEAGTQLVKDINPGSASSQRGVNFAGGPQQFDFAAVVNGIAYFEATDGVNGLEVWRTDGTEAGTYMVKNANPFSTPSLASLTAFDGALYFTLNTTYGTELWKSDGTDAGTFMLKDIYIAGNADVKSLVVSGGTLFFTANDGTSGVELWTTDGTAEGTVPVEDINAAGGSSPTTLTDVAGTASSAARLRQCGWEITFTSPPATCRRSSGAATGPPPAPRSCASSCTRRRCRRTGA